MNEIGTSIHSRLDEIEKGLRWMTDVINAIESNVYITVPVEIKHKKNKKKLRVEQLRKMPYKEYLQTREWKDKARKAKKRARNRCQICNRPQTEVILDVHHRTYERRGQERPDDLTVLCRECHKIFEENRERVGRKPLRKTA